MSEKRKERSKIEKKCKKRKCDSSYHLNDCSHSRISDKRQTNKFYSSNVKKGVSVTHSTLHLKNLHERFQVFLQKPKSKFQSSTSANEPHSSCLDCSGSVGKGDVEELSEGEIVDEDEYTTDLIRKQTDNVNEDELLKGRSESTYEETDDDSRRKNRDTAKNSPGRLHKELNYNTKGQEEGHCLCKHENTQKWVIHSVFEAERLYQRCCPTTNNADKLWHYRLSITPATNFTTNLPSCIEHHGRLYVFEGFSLLSHYSLSQIPRCTFVQYHREYTVDHIKEEIPNNFCIKDLNLFQKYVLEELLEVDDWKLQGEDGCQVFHFLPRFIYRKDRFPQRMSDSFGNEKESRTDFASPKKKQRCSDKWRYENDGGKYQKRPHGDHDVRRDASYDDVNGDEQDWDLLSMNVVLDHLLKSYEPVFEPSSQPWSKGQWRDYERQLCNSLVAIPGKKPCCIRLDGLTNNNEADQDINQDKTYPRVNHICARTAKMSYMSDEKYLQLKQEMKKLKRNMMGKTVSTAAEKNRLKKAKEALWKIKAMRDLKKQVKIHISAKGLYKTGIKSDVTQNLVALSFVVDHLRYHRSLDELEQKMDYRFKNRSILQTALRHSSANLNTLSSAHLKVTELNCGKRDLDFGDGNVHKLYKREKGLHSLSKVMTKLAETKECPSNLKQNESLEFLGDAVLELVTTSHLFFLFGCLSEGALNTFRAALVQNKYLTKIAKRFRLEHFMYFGHGYDKSQAPFDHALGNCVEAILGAVYLDSRYGEAEKLTRNMLFEEEDLRDIWKKLPKHYLQRREPSGDRHLISEYKFLQPFVKLEKQIGIEFSHICLLAKAFTLPSAPLSDVIGGNNQRLEFFGDSILKLLISDYLFKHFPDHQEGHLTLLRSSLVNAKCQATVAEELGLHDYVRLGNEKVDFSTTHMKKLADIFEAFIAAVYIDQGIEYCKKICEVCVMPKLEGFIVKQNWMDSKSRLQHFCLFERDDLRTKENPVYKLLEATGADKSKRFRVAVYFREKRIGTGIGNSHQGAEKAAAADALQSKFYNQVEKQKRMLHRNATKKREKRAASQTR